VNQHEVKLQDGKLTLSAIPGQEVCDFCSSPEIVKDYDCQDFHLPVGGSTMTAGSLGKWASCAECARLIDAEDREGLVVRSLECFYRNNPQTRLSQAEGIKRFLEELHGEFWRLKRG
jgi:hypothetical protein